MTRTYSELILLPTFEERFEYLKLSGIVCEETFASKRYLNQALYWSKEWKEFRREIIIRDLGCDLGVEGYEIQTRPLIHHINPITKDMIINRDPLIFSRDNVITTTHRTHNAIHYGDASLIYATPTVRSQNDTCPWKH